MHQALSCSRAFVQAFPPLRMSLSFPLPGQLLLLLLISANCPVLREASRDPAVKGRALVCPSTPPFFLSQCLPQFVIYTYLLVFWVGIFKCSCALSSMEPRMGVEHVAQAWPQLACTFPNYVVNECAASTRLASSFPRPTVDL